MEVIRQLKKIITEALNELGVGNPMVSFEHPTELTHGDYSTNAAMVYAKELGKNPRLLAEEIKEYIENQKPEGVSVVDIAGPGFINFTLSKDYFSSILKDVRERGEVWGSNALHAGEKILVEHSSPNLFKPFHIGHVMNNVIGESITRLARFSGASVTEISYPSDISLGIGKALWMLMQDGGISKLDSFGSSVETLAYLGECYVRGTKRYEEDADAAKEMRDLTMLLYSHDESSDAYKTYAAAKRINLDYFKAITARLGSRFDDFIYEGEAGIEGAAIVRENIPNVFEQSEGATVYKGEQDGLHTRVFINKDGNPTYEAKDIGLLSLKFKKFSPDISIFITDHEQEDYFKVVAAAAGKIKQEWKEKTIHRTHGRMSFKGQKMSSRLGGVPLAQTLLDTLFEEVRERATRELAHEGMDAVAIAALKFSILRVMAGKNINFDPETSLSFEGDSGPYLQYTAVRAVSVLAKAKGEHIFPEYHMPAEWHLTMLERLLGRFPEVVAQSIELWAPHHLVTYLLMLAQSFNTWYGETKIVDAEDALSPYKLALVESFATTMKNGLYLLGIPTPEKM